MNVRTLIAPNPSPFTLDGTRTYLIGDDVVIDPGPAIEAHVDAILEQQPGLTTVFVTHRHSDHAPAAAALKSRKPGVRIIAPPAAVDSDLIDEVLLDGACFETATTTVCAIATPGHTAEHFCFLTNRGELFSGDTVLGTGTTAIFPPDGKLSDYLASLSKLRKLSASVIYPGHGERIDEPTEVIDRYIEHRKTRESEILRELAEAPSTIPSLREKIYPQLAEGLERAAESQLLAHLLYLIEQGLVSEEHETYTLAAR